MAEFEAWKLCKCNECCRGDGLPGYDCIIDELEQAHRAGLEDAARRVEIFLATDKYAAKENIPGIIRALPSADERNGSCDHSWGAWVSAVNQVIQSGELRVCNRCGVSEIRGARIGQGEPAVSSVNRDDRLGMNRCHADRDGDCTWEHCPQLRDGEPERSGRSCPLWVRDLRKESEDEEAW